MMKMATKSPKVFSTGKKKAPVKTGNKLMTFLLGTTDRHSPLQILRGKGDILRIIWIYACSEWWNLHFQTYQIPSLPDPDYNYDQEAIAAIEAIDAASPIADLRNHKLFERKKYFDCPLAILRTEVAFPPIGTMPNSSDPININMMPFDILDLEGTLPTYVYGYLEMIEHCRSYLMVHHDKLTADGIKAKRKPDYREKPRQALDFTDIRNRIAYLTIDERPVEEVGKSHRRGGVHVECPGALRRKEVADKSKYTPDLCWYHPWGLGRAVDEYLVGGIFLASNMSNSTAVWNMRVHDTFGDIIGPHGSLERCRELLGPPTKTLAAGELVWMSDRTPHESLPITDTSQRRQFFRLVVGEIGFWYAEHNTPNPLGLPLLPAHVPVIEGNKFHLVRELVPIVWECGSEEELRVAREEAEFRNLLYQQSVGFLADDLLKLGIYNHETLREKFEEAEKFIEALDPHLYSNYTKRFMEVGLSRILYNFYD